MVEVQFQGSLVKATGTYVRAGKNATAPRGEIVQFSRKSRKRLIELCNRLDKKSSLRRVFITLTFPYHETDYARAKRLGRNMMRRLQRRGATSIIWRMELQKSGRIHFHLIVFGLGWIDHDELKALWRDVLGWDGEHLIVDIRQIKSVRQLLSYVSKYVAKVASLDTAPYLTTQSTGRWWGVIGRKGLPLDELFVIVIRSVKIYFKFRELARKLHDNRAFRSRYPTGWTLFASDAYEWLDELVKLKLDLRDD